jgi:ureidoglycolate lyase
MSSARACLRSRIQLEDKHWTELQIRTELETPLSTPYNLTYTHRNMPLSTMAPSREVPVRSLNGASFQEFGEVIEDPATHDDTLSFETIEANQGSARKVLNVTHMNNYYALSQSKKPASSVVNMFVCKPRSLEQQDGEGIFPVKILERHPFTPQTFVPMGLDAKDKETAYLVIVAPTLPLSQRAREEGHMPPYPSAPPKKKPSLRERLLGSRPNPFTNDYNPAITPPVTFESSASQKPKGHGLPDLSRLQAFMARGDQAVTYGPGTWHAPMVVLGKRPIEFVVLQYANGVAIEDCQEVDVVTPEGGRGLSVVIENDALAVRPTVKAKL